VVHAVLDRHAPGVRVIDVTHEIAAHDVWAGALTLWRAAPWLAPAVILAVVDPGVGTERRALAVEVAGAGTVLVGPDNGLLLPAALRLGPITAAVELAGEVVARRSGAHRSGADRQLGATFAGRDLFAPAAAQIAAGVPVRQLGVPVDPAGLAGQQLPEPVAAGDDLETVVLWIDRYGNAQLNATPQDVGASVVEVSIAGRPAFVARVVNSYGAIAPDPMALVIDSYGFVSLSGDQRSAAHHLGLEAGQPVRLGRVVTARR
jgi:S-adenosyl-L-methionine hydrolase (adenosine-forming)